ncbi:MAG: GGDEF domain-containing protein [Candidatus Saccharimonadales bacterium]|jgi:GGDEF domain-containing protein
MTNFDNKPSTQFPLDTSRIMPKATWHKLLEREVNAAQENHKPISVIFIDIDNLKYTNDTYGHAEGDQIIDHLQRSIILIQNSFRTHNKVDSDRLLDIVTIDTPRKAKELVTEVENRHIVIKPGRIGGDEFAVLCHTDAEGVNVIVNRLREIFRNFISKKLRSAGVDISIGSSTLEPNMPVSKLLQLADDKLYIDKQSHLPKLNDKDVIVFREIIHKLKQMNIRPRDISKYEAIYVKDLKKSRN